MQTFDDKHLALLMSWVGDAHACRIWGGPRFRFPFDRETFVLDCCLDNMRSYLLLSPSGEPLAFGQLYEKSQRIHLARLIVNPRRRRAGHGASLIRELIVEGMRLFRLEETSLYVYKYNSPAQSCYRQLGYSDAPPPKEDAGVDGCLFLVAKAADVFARC